MVPFAWHRLVLPLPEKWSPLKLQGDAQKGYVEFADLQRPRLGVRWRRLRRAPGRGKGGGGVEKMLFAVIKAEAGQLAAQESARPEELPVGASHALVYEDTKPFKRDIAVVYFPDSRRLVQLVYPLRRRENVLQQDILPGLRVVSEQSPAPWSVFGLTCLSPVGLELERHRLNAGDLSLTFLGKRRRGVLQSWASIREIAAPGLALKKSSIRGWMRTMQRPDDRFYKPVAGVEEAELAVGGRSFRADVLPMVRRRRYFFLPGPKGCVTLACHDTHRDRLVLVHGTDETMVRGLAGTMGVRLAEGVMLEGE